MQQFKRRVALVLVVLAGSMVLPTSLRPAAALSPQPVEPFVVPVPANGIVHDPTRDVLYASVGRDGGGWANSVVAIDVVTGAVGASVYVGSEPTKLAISDDGQFLYVALSAIGAIRRVTLATFTADLQVGVGGTPCGLYRIDHLAVMPAHPATFAVARDASCHSDGAGIVVYDGAVQRPEVAHVPYPFVFSTDDPSLLYAVAPTGYDTTYRVRVTASGTEVVDWYDDLLREGTGPSLAYDSGLLFSGWGVADTATMTLVSQATLPASSPASVHAVLPDVASGTAALMGDGWYWRIDVRTGRALDWVSIEMPTIPGSRDGLYDFADLGGGLYAISTSVNVLLFDWGGIRGASGEYTPLTPARVLDTRTGTGTGGAIGPVGPAGTRDVQIAGVGGVPPVGVDSVVLNATVAAPTEQSYLAVWPSGGPMPDSSNLNYAAGETRANLVTVPIGAGGKVSLFNERGDAHVIFDVVGFYATAGGPVGSRFRPLSPSRLFDTRGGAPVGPGGVHRFDVTGVGGVPDAGVTAVAINVTAVNATANSYITVWPDDVGQPNASNLNFPAGGTVPNLVVMRVPVSGVIDFFNESGDVHLLADVVGYYTSDRSSEGGRFVSFWPSRFLDTRLDEAGALFPGDTVYFEGRDEPYAGYVLNVTVTGTRGAGYVTVHPWPGEAPDASSLNYGDNVSVPNAVIVRTGPGMAFSNFTGAAHLIADVFGAFTAP